MSTNQKQNRQLMMVTHTPLRAIYFLKQTLLHRQFVI